MYARMLLCATKATHLRRGAANLARAQPAQSALLICDLQQKFRTNVAHFTAVVEATRRVLAAARILHVPVLATEQYPRGLGSTVEELDLPGCGVTPISKTQFSMCVPAVREWLKERQPSTVVLCGIETHVCVEHTVRDILATTGDDSRMVVRVVADATSSRSEVDRRLALHRMQQMGAVLCTAESLILEWTGDAAHERFKQLQEIIKHPASDCGLVDF